MAELDKGRATSLPSRNLDEGWSLRSRLTCIQSMSCASFLQRFAGTDSPYLCDERYDS